MNNIQTLKESDRHTNDSKSNSNVYDNRQAPVQLSSDNKNYKENNYIGITSYMNQNKNTKQKLTGSAERQSLNDSKADVGSHSKRSHYNSSTQESPGQFFEREKKTYSY